MPGFVHGFHEGSRSEYIAAYVFSAFGTSSLIPHQEDHGFDLYCTLSSGKGNTRFAAKPYTVQVKSSSEPSWPLKNKGDVDWFIGHPLPLFLCVVDKEELRLTVFQTTPKFYYWTLGSVMELPESLTLCPRFDSTEGECKGWQETGSADLSAPILKFTLDELSHDTFLQNVRRVLDSWIDMDYENLFHITTGTRQWMSPGKYRTNEIIAARSERSGPAATADEPRLVMGNLKSSMAWIMLESMRFGDWKGALRVALLLRHFCREDDHYSGRFCTWFDHVRGVVPSYVFDTLDRIATQIDAAAPRQLGQLPG